MFEVTERLYQTADGKVVPAGHPDARLLYAAKGRQLTTAEATRVGLIKGHTAPVAETPESKTITYGTPEPFICDVCGKVTKSKAGLVSHQSKKHGEGD